MVQRYKFSIELKNSPPDLSGEPKLALFVNRMIDYMPDYTTNSGMTVRRTSKPFFGMEINFNI